MHRDWKYKLPALLCGFFHTFLTFVIAFFFFFLTIHPGILYCAPPHIETVGFLVGSGGLGDQSYNDMTFTGIGKAQKQFDFRVVIEETSGTVLSQKKAIEQLLKQDVQVIVANGADLNKIIKNYAPKYSEKYFIVNDYAISDYPNIASTVFAHEEGSYLTGLLAASYSRSKQIGFIGGVDLPVIHSFLNGYRLGAQSIYPDITIDVAFVTPSGDFSGFGKPGRGFEIAAQMYSQGVDIIYSVAGLTGNGVIQAALKNNKMMIGVDSDQDHMAKGHVLTSMMKRLDRSTYLELSSIIKGDFKPGIKYYSLKNGGISLSPMRFTRHLIPETTFNLLTKAKQDIIDGKIKIK
jgi:basic membrane protein A